MGLESKNMSFETNRNKVQKITIKISGDNSEIMSCLDEIEKKVDLINAKLEKMAQLSGQIKGV